MTFNGLLLHKVLKMLEKLCGLSLRQVYQSGKSSYYFKFSKGTMQISVDPVYPFVLFRHGHDRELGSESAFLKVLRMKLNGAVLVEVTQQGLDRVLDLSFHRKTPFGEIEIYHLFVELMGPGSNLILTDEKSKIIALLKKRITEKRTLLSGSRYEPPERSGLNIVGMDWRLYTEYLETIGYQIKKIRIQGFDGKSLNNFLQLLSIAGDGVLTVEETRRLFNALKELERTLSTPNIYLVNTYGKPWLSAFFVPGSQQLEITEAIDNLIENERKSMEFESERHRILKYLKKENIKIQRLLNKLNIEMRELSDYDRYRKMGELLIANLYRLKDKREVVNLKDWESGEEIRIKLDPRLSFSENARVFFKYYNRSKRKVQAVRKRIEKLEELLSYYEGLQEMFEMAQTREDLKALEIELHEAGILKKKKTTKRKTATKSGPKTFVFSGFTYIVGRSNIQNDEIRKQAAGEDLWFHARNIPGAHVILKTAGKKPGDREIRYGAYLAVLHSRGRMSGKADVDYTEVRNVWKPKGAHPGMVLYRNFRTVIVDLSEGDFDAESK
ncbi:Rqc2 family fibronectin-binding protein [Kosmotoga pacifica]|uniref:NFACT RNA-binding domain-containing protein n=1 Tax=Kosmotoga pacifica TaxID=1330330 RepID=A0A0G2Z5V7_9BACT|nr:NFACT family protein [Kosmotoga pacifica]AKI96990.1 hypothetical protein IX53_03185 [Kosmotoga pacifica]